MFQLGTKMAELICGRGWVVTFRKMVPVEVWKGFSILLPCYTTEKNVSDVFYF